MKRFIFYSLLMIMTFAGAGCDGSHRHTMEKSVWVKSELVSPCNRQERFQFPARVKAAEEVNMAFKVNGTLERVFAREGSMVHRGELLAKIDPRDYELQMQAVEAEYAGIKAEAERAIALYADSVATKAEYDKARYGLQQITAKYENAKNQLSDTRLYAPFDGWVKRKLLDAPAVVGAGMPVMTLLSSEMPEVEINIPSSVYRRREEIDTFFINLDYLDKPLPLRLINISPNVNTAQLYSVRLALPDRMKESPSVGMTAMVDVVFAPKGESMVKIPAAAIVTDGDSCFVWVVADGRVRRRNITVMQLHTDGNAVVGDGIVIGERIVSAGAHTLRENQPVKVADENASEGGAL